MFSVVFKTSFPKVVSVTSFRLDQLSSSACGWAALPSPTLVTSSSRTTSSPSDLAGIYREDHNKSHLNRAFEQMNVDLGDKTVRKLVKIIWALLNPPYLTLLLAGNKVNFIALVEYVSLVTYVSWVTTDYVSLVTMLFGWICLPDDRQ